MQNKSVPSSPVRILLVDDHAPMAEVTSEFLEMSGLDVRIAIDGKQALAFAEEFRPHIVLCDLMLPDLSGIQLATAIRANPSTKNVVFALYTALSEGEVHALEGSACDQVDLVISKPMTKEILEKLLGLLAAGA